MATASGSNAGSANNGDGNVPSFSPGKASDSVISLSQAILSPLDALFKAQIHAARSFLNLILQIGYPNIRINKETQMPLEEDLKDETRNRPFYVPFGHIVNDDKGNSAKYDINIPALALIPFNSLAIDSGEFKFGMNITYIDNHQQIQDSRAAEGDDDGKRPWYLVKDPVSMKGNITSGSGAKTGSSQETTIDIYIKVSKSPIPAALDNLLTHLTQQTLINTTTSPGSATLPPEIKTSPPVDPSP